MSIPAHVQRAHDNAERRQQPERRFIFGYEEALGYCIGETVADKDGISAALAMAHYARELRAQGSNLRARLAAIYQEIGAFVSDQWVQRFAGLDAAAAMQDAVEQARRAAPSSLNGLALADRHDFREGAPWDVTQRTNLLALTYGDASEGLRILVRPSGTEPKVKTYFEYHTAAGVKVARQHLQSAMTTWREELKA